MANSDLDDNDVIAACHRRSAPQPGRTPELRALRLSRTCSRFPHDQVPGDWTANRLPQELIFEVRCLLGGHDRSVKGRRLLALGEDLRSSRTAARR